MTDEKRRLLAFEDAEVLYQLSHTHPHIDTQGLTWTCCCEIGFALWGVEFTEGDRDGTIQVDRALA